MNVTLDESLMIYARVTMKWFGTAAQKRTRERIQQLAKAGDFEGARVHERLYQCILQMEKQRGRQL